MTVPAAIDYRAVAARYLAVWNEPDRAARADLAEQVFTDDVRYTDPLMQATGREELLQAVAAVQQRFAGWRFAPDGDVDGHHAQARFRWELGPQGQPAPVAGFDVVEVSGDGRIRTVLGFLDRVPT